MKMDRADERFVHQVQSALSLGETLQELGLAEGGAYQEWFIDQCARHGRADEDLDRLETLLALYEAFTRLASPSERLQALGTLCGLIENGETGSWALQPFIYMEDDLEVLSAAARDLVRLYEADEDDGLGGARFVRGLVDEAEDDIQRVGLLRGLLLAGDTRSEPLLRDTWRLLGFRGQQRLAESLPAAANPLTVAFLSAWLVSAEGAERSFVETALSSVKQMLKREDQP
ncbi:MAG: hypothetical protein ACYC6T_17665 [Thermoleophilia bacterium]